MSEQEHMELLTKQLNDYMQSFNKRVEVYTKKMHQTRDQMMQDVQYEIDRFDLQVNKNKTGDVNPPTPSLYVTQEEFRSSISDINSKILQMSNTLLKLMGNRK